MTIHELVQLQRAPLKPIIRIRLGGVWPNWKNCGLLSSAGNRKLWTPWSRIWARAPAKPI